jgi:dipeptidyl aminopeptidase/acylaminoacyl peptidase
MNAVKKGRAFAMAMAGVVLAAVVGVSHAGKIPPRRLVEVVDLSTPDISPDGRLVAYRAERASVERNTYGSVWYVQEMDGSAPPRRVGDGGVPIRDSAGGSFPATAVWSPDGRFIYYRALLDGRVDVWRAAVDGSGSEAVTFDPADVREFSLADDGRTLKYSTGATRDEVMRAERNEYDRGIHIDETVPVGAGLFRSSFVGGRPATQRYIGIWFARGPLLGSVPDRWREIDLETGARRVLPQEDPEPEQKPGSVDSAALPVIMFEARDPESGRTAVITRTDGGDRTKRSNLSELAILPGEDGQDPVKCGAEPCTGKAVTSVQWRPGGQEVLFTVTDRAAGESQAIFRWNIATGEVRPVVAARGFINGGRERSSVCGISASALACVAAEADSPPRLERVDIATGQRLVLFEPNAALARDLEAAISSRLLKWKDKDGKEFTGQLFTGRTGHEGKRPLFINYYHCTGFLRGGVGDEWPLASLAEAGISTLCINAPPLVADPVVRFDGALGAVEAAIELLAAEDAVDPKRVGMGGLSFGSEVALWTAMRSDLLSAVSVTSPSVTPLYYLMNSAKGDMFTSGLRAIWGLGTPEETPAQWKRLSPTYNVDTIRAPVLFQMPEEEYMYALDYIMPLMRGQRADLYVFPNEPHRKFQPRHMVAAYGRNFDWFRFWLQGVEDDDPEKAVQYARWREMRSAVGAPESQQAVARHD